MRCFFFSKLTYTSDRMQFFTILQDKLQSFNNKDAQITRFLCKANYRINHIIKRFHEENSIMSGLFRQNNLLLCGMQGNNGFSAKTLNSFQNHLYSHSGSYFWQAPNLQCELTLFGQDNKEFLILILHLIVLLCVIFKSVWYPQQFKYSCKRCSDVRLKKKNRQSDFFSGRDTILTINRKKIKFGEAFKDRTIVIHKEKYWDESIFVEYTLL